MHGFRLSAIFLAASACMQSAQAQDCGLWNVPGNTGQFFGHGFGAGHHAPMVRAPRRHPHHVPRVAVDLSRTRRSAGYPIRHGHTGYQMPASCQSGACATYALPVHHSVHQMAPPSRRVQPMGMTPTTPMPGAPAATPPAVPMIPPPSRPTKQEPLPTPKMPEPDTTAGGVNVPAWMNR